MVYLLLITLVQLILYNIIYKDLTKSFLFIDINYKYCLEISIYIVVLYYISYKNGLNYLMNKLNDFFTLLINLLIIFIFLNIYLYLIFDISLYEYKGDLFLNLYYYRIFGIIFLSIFLIILKKIDKLLNFFLIICVMSLLTHIMNLANFTLNDEFMNLFYLLIQIINKKTFYPHFNNSPENIFASQFNLEEINLNFNNDDILKKRSTKSKLLFGLLTIDTSTFRPYKLPKLNILGELVNIDLNKLFVKKEFFIDTNLYVITPKEKLVINLLSKEIGSFKEEFIKDKFYTKKDSRTIPVFTQKKDIYKLPLVMNSERLIIRRFNNEDFEDYMSLGNEDERSLNLYGVGRAGFTERASRYAVNNKQENVKDYGVFLKDFETNQEKEFIGLIGIMDTPYRWPCISYILKQKYWHKNYGTEMLQTLIQSVLNAPNKEAFIEIKEANLKNRNTGEIVQQLKADTDISNVVSQKLLSKVGFNKTSVFNSGDHWSYDWSLTEDQFIQNKILPKYTSTINKKLEKFNLSYISLLYK